MRKALFSTLAVLMTASANFVFAQSNNVAILDDNGKKSLEITYVSEAPEYIAFDMVGGDRLRVGLYGQTSNVSNHDGTCTASYDIQTLLDSPSGEMFRNSYAECDKIYVYHTTEKEFLFEVDASDLSK